jgi:tetratricopeptide (TPR) repeat protein
MYSMARRDYEHAIRMFEQAIGVDSKYALAYAGLADAYSHMYRYVEASAENVEKANRASEQTEGGDELPSGYCHALQTSLCVLLKRTKRNLYRTRE